MRWEKRIQIVRDWAEMNPYEGVHDAPEEVKKALGYEGHGAEILKDRMRRNRKADAALPKEQ